MLGEKFSIPGIRGLRGVPAQCNCFLYKWCIGENNIHKMKVAVSIKIETVPDNYGCVKTIFAAFGA